MTYIVLRLYVCAPIQQESDASIMAIESSPMEGGSSTLYIYKDNRTGYVCIEVCIETCIHVYMHVCLAWMEVR